MVAPALPALCELVWVSSRGYKIPSVEIVATIRRLMNAANIVVNRPAAEAGLALLEAGSDFADGVIAYEGDWLGAETLVSFDKEAVKLMKARGEFCPLAAVETQPAHDVVIAIMAGVARTPVARLWLRQEKIAPLEWRAPSYAGVGDAPAGLQSNSGGGRARP